jgi:hypothetical protein
MNDDPSNAELASILSIQLGCHHHDTLFMGIYGVWPEPMAVVVYLPREACTVAIILSTTDGSDSLGNN